jgi:ABC transport system ATP-binding/permease protein
MLMKKLANAGRTVILVTHATASVNQADKMIFMGKGGYVCFYGQPSEIGSEAEGGFPLPNTSDFTDVYDTLNTESAVQSQAQRFRQSSLFQRYMQTPIPPAATSKQSPVASSSFISQFFVLCQRYVQLLLRDQGNLFLLLLQAPILGLVLNLVTKDNVLTQNPLEAEIPLFIMTTAALWFGIFNSIREIVKERVIFERERMVNLSVGAYLLSKGVVLSFLAVIQALMLTLITGIHILPAVTDPVGHGLLLFGTLVLTILASSSLGLLVSALVPNPGWANSLAPLLLIPQLIFGGVLFSSRDGVGMVGVAMQSKWSMDALGNIFELNALYQSKTGKDTEMLKELKASPPLQGVINPLEVAQKIEATLSLQKRLVRYPKPGYDQPLSLIWGVLGGFSLLFLGLAFFALGRKQ